MTDQAYQDTPTRELVMPGNPPPRLASAKAASCCGGSGETQAASCCAPAAADAPAWRRIDWLLWGSGSVIAVAYLAGFFLPHDAPLGLGVFTHGVQEIMNLMWWGILVGMLAVGLIDRVPRAFVIGIIGRDRGRRAWCARCWRACCSISATTVS